MSLIFVLRLKLVICLTRIVYNAMLFNYSTTYFMIFIQIGFHQISVEAALVLSSLSVQSFVLLRVPPLNCPIPPSVLVVEVDDELSDRLKSKIDVNSLNHLYTIN